MIKYICAKCKTPVEAEKKFVAENGMILCKKCRQGVKEAPMELLAKSEIIDIVDKQLGINILNCTDLQVNKTVANIIYNFNYKNILYTAVYSIKTKKVSLKKQVV